MFLSINPTKMISDYRNQKVIATMTKYYNGDITTFPYSKRTLGKTKKWYMKLSHDRIDKIVVNRIAMMEQVVSNN